MPADKKVDPAYKDVLKEFPYQDMPLRKGADLARQQRLGTAVVVPRGSPSEGKVRRVERQFATGDAERNTSLSQGYRRVGLIKQPRDTGQLERHQHAARPFKPPARKGR